MKPFPITTTTVKIKVQQINSTATMDKSWNLTADIELLAWLDLCKERKLDFEKTIVRHLSENEIKVCKADVDNRLVALRRQEAEDTYGECHEDSDSAIFSFLKDTRMQGSLIFEDLSPDFRARINRRLMNLKMRNSENLRPKDSAVACKKHEQKITNIGSFPLQDSARSGARNRPSAGPHEPGASEENPIALNTESSTSTPTNKTNFQFAANDVQAMVMPSIVTCGGMQQQAYQATGGWDEIRAIRGLWDQAAENFHRREEELTETIQRLEAEKSHMELARKERDRACGHPYEETSYLKNHEIWALSQQLQRIAENSIFARLEPENETPFNSDDIDKAINTIQFELQSIMCGHDFRAYLQIPKIERQSDFGSLIRSALEIGQDDRHLGPVKAMLARFDPRHIIRIFFVAALRDWVFMSDYPNFTPVDDRHDYLRAYRDIIMIVGRDSPLAFIGDLYPYPLAGGWKQLHNFDKQAYHNILERSTVQNCTLPRKAKHLATRLSKALAPLFRQAEVSSDRLFETWGEEATTWQARQSRFTRIFNAALQLKCITVLTAQKYAFVLHAGGNSSAPELELAGPNSEYWNLATLKVFRSPNTSSTISPIDAVVNTRNFVMDIERRGDMEMIYQKDVLISKGKYPRRT